MPQSWRRPMAALCSDTGKGKAPMLSQSEAISSMNGSFIAKKLQYFNDILPAFKWRHVHQPCHTHPCFQAPNLVLEIKHPDFPDLSF